MHTIKKLGILLVRHHQKRVNSCDVDKYHTYNSCEDKNHQRLDKAHYEIGVAHWFIVDDATCKSEVPGVNQDRADDLFSLDTIEGEKNL